MSIDTDLAQPTILGNDRLPRHGLPEQQQAQRSVRERVVESRAILGDAVTSEGKVIPNSRGWADGPSAAEQLWPNGV